MPYPIAMQYDALYGLIGRNLRRMMFFAKKYAVVIGLVFAGMWAVAELSLDGTLVRAEIDEKRARSVPSLDFSFRTRLYNEGEYAVIDVVVENKGVNPVVLELGRLDGVDTRFNEDFYDIAIVCVERGVPIEWLDYLQADGDFRDWVRVLVDVGSTKVIPYLWKSPPPGLYYIEFKARLDRHASENLRRTHPGTFNDAMPIFWTASTYVDLYEEAQRVGDSRRPSAPE